MLAAKTMLSRRMRLDDLAYPILKANADICPKAEHRAGFQVVTKWTYADMHPVYEKAYTDILGLRSGGLYGERGERFTVVWVAPDSAAQKAGMLPGDEIAEIEGVEVPKVESKRKLHRAGGRYASMLDDAYEDGHLELGILRCGVPERLVVDLDTVCAYGVHFVHDSNELNA